MEYCRYAEQVAQLVLLACLFYRGLAKSYPLFTCYLAVRILRAASLLSLNYHGMLYAKAWALSEPGLLVLQSLVVLELTESVLEFYPEIGHVAKVLVGWSLSIGALLGGSLAVVEATNLRTQPLWLLIVMGIWKWISLTCTLTLLLQSAWFSAFPLPMRSNVAIHRWMLTIFIGIVPGCSAILVQLKIRGMADLIVFSQVVLEAACCITWILLLEKSGEQIRYRPDWISREDRGRVRREYVLFIETIRRKLSGPNSLVNNVAGNRIITSHTDS